MRYELIGEPFDFVISQPTRVQLVARLVGEELSALDFGGLGLGRTFDRWAPFLGLQRPGRMSFHGYVSSPTAGPYAQPAGFGVHVKEST